MTDSPSTFDTLFQEEVYRTTTRVQIVLSKAYEAHTEEELVTLSKLVSALRLTMGGIQIAPDINSLHLAERAIVFGDQLLPHVPLYEVYNLNGVQILKSDSLDVLNKSEENKKVLWKTLKAMFEL